MSKARAHANIALVKYWGKRALDRNLPAAGSLSLTLAALATETSVTFGHEFDALTLNGESVDGSALGRVSSWLDIVRAVNPVLGGAHVESNSNFPTASGLASSASAFAALAVAATSAAGLELSPRELSVLARRGSGSAARSIFGGLVRMHAGSESDGSDSFAEQICDRDALADWPLTMVIAVVGGGVAKKTSSRDAMEHCAKTSPLYRAWLDCVPSDLEAAGAAIAARDLAALGEICEGSAFAMHAAAIASRPATVFFQPATLATIDAVRDLRANSGCPAYVTMDAGPHVKVLTVTEHVEAIKQTLATIEGVTSIIISSVGGPAAVFEDS